MQAGYDTASKILHNTEPQKVARGRRLVPKVSQVSLSMDEETIQAQCESHEVQVDLNNCSCECNYFETYGKPCQHIAAVALHVVGVDWEPSEVSLASSFESQGIQGNAQLNQLLSQMGQTKDLSLLKTASDLIADLPELYYLLQVTPPDQVKKNSLGHEESPPWVIEVYLDDQYEKRSKCASLIEKYTWPDEILQKLKFIQKAFEVKHWSAHVADKVMGVFRYFKNETLAYVDINGEIKELQLMSQSVTMKLRISELERASSRLLICEPLFFGLQEPLSPETELQCIYDTTSALLAGGRLYSLESPFHDPVLLSGFLNKIEVDEFDREAFLWNLQDLEQEYLEIPEHLQPEELEIQPQQSLILKMNSHGLEMSLAFIYHPEHFKISFQNSTSDTVYYEEGRFHHVRRDNETEAQLKDQFEDVVRSVMGAKEAKKILREAWYGEYFVAQASIEKFVKEVLPLVPHVDFENEEILDPWKVVEAELEIQLGSGIDWFELEGQVKFGEFTLSLMDLLRQMYLEGKESYVKLEDGTKGLIPAELVALLERIDATKSEISNPDSSNQSSGDAIAISKFQTSLIQELYDLQCVQVQDRKAWKKQLKELALEPAPERPIPDTIKATLRPYQEEGVHWLRTMDAWGTGGVLADDMGLGKTLQVITMLEMVRDNHIGASLIVVPTSLLFNWEREFEKFAPHFKVKRYYGAKRNHLWEELLENLGVGTGEKPLVEVDDEEPSESVEDQAKSSSSSSGSQPGEFIDMFAAFLAEEKAKLEGGPKKKSTKKKPAKQPQPKGRVKKSSTRQKVYEKLNLAQTVYITSYQVMQRDIQKLMGVEFDFVILDESQAIKNPSTKTHKAARLLKARKRLAMTGTPVENNLMDLWAQMDFLNPGFLGKKKFFQEHFQRPIQDKKNKARAESLRSIVEPFYLRRTKEVVLKDLPPKQDLITWVSMGPEQQKLYDQTRDHYRKELMEQMEEEGAEKSKIDVLQGLLRLRQIACDPRLQDPDSKVPSAKMELLIEKLEEDVLENHKALVFSQFTSLLKIVGSELEKKGFEYSYLDGATRDREAVIKKFTDNEERKIFLISLKAGGVGLNLTQADYVFHLDPWWNPAAEDQATARAHRMGQQNTVMNYKLIAAGTVEEKILELQQQKKNLADEILSSDAGIVSELSPELVERLFS